MAEMIKKSLRKDSEKGNPKTPAAHLVQVHWKPHGSSCSQGDVALCLVGVPGYRPLDILATCKVRW